MPYTGDDLERARALVACVTPLFSYNKVVPQVAEALAAERAAEYQRQVANVTQQVVRLPESLAAARVALDKVQNDGHNYGPRHDLLGELLARERHIVDTIVQDLAYLRRDEGLAEWRARIRKLGVDEIQARQVKALESIAESLVKLTTKQEGTP